MTDPIAIPAAADGDTNDEPVVVPVRPDRHLVRRTFGFKRPSRRTFGFRRPSRRTFGNRRPSRRTFGYKRPSRRTFGFSRP